MPQFLELTLPFIPYGIPMFPLQTRPADGKGNPEVAKQPWEGLGGWQFKATSDPELLIQMNRDICHEQDANCALVAKAEPEGVCFWEFDEATIEQVCAEANQPRPVTLEQRSGRGGCHLVFRHTPRSIELGNRNAKGSGGDELWSFRADNKYLVAAGSTHPNGKLYELVRDCKPIPVPDWVVGYITSHGNADRPKPIIGNGPSLDADFDFDDFLDHYKLTLDGRETDGWNTLSECPAVERRHLGNGTAIYHDGESLHWSCLAGDCDLHGKTMGEVIRWLNTEGGFEPYPGPIWEKQSDEDFCKAMGIEMVYNDPEPQKAEPAANLRTAVEILKGVVVPETLREDAPKPTPQPVLLPPQPEPLQPEPAPPTPVEFQTPDLEFPEAALYGRLGELAKGMKMPLGLAYPALLACYSVVPNVDEMCGVRINLYTALIARKGGGKNTAIRRAKESLWIPPEGCSKFAAGGDTQLCVALGDKPKMNEKGNRDGKKREPGPRKMLLLNNELSEMLKKSGIDASTLADRLCDFYDDNEFQKMVRGDMVKVNCRISWLGGVPATVEEPDRFRELFGTSTNDGLYERFIFGYEGTRRFKHRKWERPMPPLQNGDLEDDIVMGVHGCTLVQSIHPDAEALKDEWISPREDEEGNTRLEFLLLKVAILAASANDEEEVSVPCMRAAIAFLEWQGKLKEVFQVGMAKNLEAEFDAMAIDAIQRLNEKTRDIREVEEATPRPQVG